jgi:hypothetical protein
MSEGNKKSEVGGPKSEEVKGKRLKAKGLSAGNQNKSETKNKSEIEDLQRSPSDRNPK